MHPNHRHAPGPGPSRPGPVFDAALRGAEFQKLDRSKIADITADALGGIEQHMRLGAKRVALDAQIGALCHGIARRKITKRDRKRVRHHIRHVLGHQYRIAHQPCRLPLSQTV